MQVRHKLVHEDEFSVLGKGLFESVEIEDNLSLRITIIMTDTSTVHCTMAPPLFLGVIFVYRMCGFIHGIFFTFGFEMIRKQLN